MAKKKIRSKYKGVYFSRMKSKSIKKNNKESTYTNCYWKAQIRINKAYKYLGLFPFNDEGEKAAAQTYNDAAIEVFGANAVLNEIPATG
jgi:hypothetical protein